MPTILVVDDDDVIRELVKFKLGTAGYEVQMESDGEAGLAAARELAPDLLLVDWMMPRLSGPELCRALRDDPETAHIPVILLTAKAQEPDVERGFQAGAIDYIVKPFSPRELLHRVTAQLARAGRG